LRNPPWKKCSPVHYVRTWKSLRYWREQQPSNHGDAGSSSVRGVGTACYTEADQLLTSFFTAVYKIAGSRVSSGSIVSDYGLDDRAIGVRSPAGAKDFSSILCVQTGSGAHPASCTMGTGGPFPGGKSAAGAWRWPLTPIKCRGREWVGAIPPLPPSASMACSGTAFLRKIAGVQFKC
jgi:hypothetical protein